MDRPSRPPDGQPVPGHHVPRVPMPDTPITPVAKRKIGPTFVPGPGYVPPPAGLPSGKTGDAASERLSDLSWQPDQQDELLVDVSAEHAAGSAPPKSSAGSDDAFAESEAIQAPGFEESPEEEETSQDREEFSPRGHGVPPPAEAEDPTRRPTDGDAIPAAAAGSRRGPREEPTPIPHVPHTAGERQPEHIPTAAVTEGLIDARLARAVEPKPLVELKSDDGRVGILKRIATAAVESAHRGSNQQAEPLMVLSTLKGLDQADTFVVQSKYLLHDVALGDPARALLGIAKVSGPAADATVDLVACFELPFNDLLLWLRRAVQVYGIALGVVAGQPALVIESVKSLVVDEMIRQVKRELVEAMTEPAHSEPGDAHIPTVAERRPDVQELVDLAKARGMEHLAIGPLTPGSTHSQPDRSALPVVRTSRPG